MADFFQTILLSNNFIEVDQALFGATELFKSRFPEKDYDSHYIPPFAYRASEKAHETTNLSIKKVWLLTLMVCFTEIGDFAITNSNPQKMRKTLNWLKTELPDVFQGKLSDKKNPKECLIGDVLEYYASA